MLMEDDLKRGGLLWKDLTRSDHDWNKWKSAVCGLYSGTGWKDDDDDDDTVKRNHYKARVYLLILDQSFSDMQTIHTLSYYGLKSIQNHSHMINLFVNFWQASDFLLNYTFSIFINSYWRVTTVNLNEQNFDL